jgi:hypothetical protein
MLDTMPVNCILEERRIWAKTIFGNKPDNDLEEVHSSSAM